MLHFFRSTCHCFVLFQVIFRLNFLSVSLCVVLRHTYMIDYFVPLITVCYILSAVLMYLCMVVTISMSSLAKLFICSSPAFLKHVVFLGIVSTGFICCDAIHSHRWIFDAIFFQGCVKVFQICKIIEIFFVLAIEQK